MTIYYDTDGNVVQVDSSTSYGDGNDNVTTTKTTYYDENGLPTQTVSQTDDQSMGGTRTVTVTSYDTTTGKVTGQSFSSWVPGELGSTQSDDFDMAYFADGTSTQTRYIVRESLQPDGTIGYESHMGFTDVDAAGQVIGTTTIDRKPLFVP